MNLYGKVILTKIYKGKDKRKMVFAYFMMRTGGRRNVRIKPFTIREYAEFREKCSQKMIEDNPMKNPESVQKMLDSRGSTKGIPKSPEFRIKMSEIMKGNTNANGKKSEEHKRKISSSHVGLTHSDETKSKMSEISKNQHKINRVCSIANQKEYATAIFLSLIARGVAV